MGYAKQHAKKPPVSKRSSTASLGASSPAGKTSGASKVTKTMAVNGSQKPRPHQQDVMHRLRRVEGQIRGILAMMEKDQPCDAIAQQLSAARKALDRAFYEMMACSLETEISESVDADPAELTARIAEKTKLLAKYA